MFSVCCEARLKRGVGGGGRQGRQYRPNVVRVGLSVHHSVESVSLDAAVASRLRHSADSRVSPPSPPTPIISPSLRPPLYSNSCIILPCLSLPPLSRVLFVGAHARSCVCACVHVCVGWVRAMLRVQGRVQTCGGGPRGCT